MKFSQDEREVIWKVLLLFKPYKKKILVIFSCILLSSGISMILPLISKNLMDNGFISGNLTVVIKLSAVTLILVLFDQGIGMLETMYQAYLNSIIPYNLSKKAFKHTIKLKIQYFNNVGIIELMSNIGMDVGNIARITDRATFFIITSIFKIFGGLIGLLLIDWRLTLLVVTILPVRYFIVKGLAKIRKKSMESLIEASRDYSAWYGDTLGGVKEVKLWGLERIKCGQFIKKQRNVIKTNIKLSITDKINEFSESVMFQIITSVLYIVGAYMISGKSFTVGGMFAFVTYSAYVTGPISAILNIGYSFSGILPSAKRLFEFFKMEVEYSEAENVVLDPSEILGSIKFEDVSFSYKNGEQALKNISFEIKPGDKVAIIGANGSGKSTVINLLLRFYMPDSGKILLDNTDISTLKLKKFRENITVVSQEVYLFNTSVKENIDLFNSMDEIRINMAARDSMAHEFIENLPRKYDTNVGKNGAKLSGGERQKIAVSRAFARDSKILILDEATSNYDVVSEEYVSRILDKHFKEKTVIVITHRSDILKHMDKVIVLDKGCIQDIGGHEEIYSRNELYRMMVEKGKQKSA